MIKAEELRIGNYAIDSLYGTEVQVSINHFSDDAFNKLEPIPLSEEWLVKMGFQNHPDNPFWFKRGFLMIGLIGVAEMMNESGEVVRISSWVNNVHQVQNLVHSLTGEELTIKN